MENMKQYKVTSSRLVGHARGDIVSEDGFAGANVESLLEAGHIAEIGSKVTKKDNDKQPKVEE
jgi:hypothetical protein